MKIKIEEKDNYDYYVQKENTNMIAVELRERHHNQYKES